MNCFSAVWCSRRGWKKAGVPAHVDVYPTGFHAFDMLLPFRKISKQAIAEFERQYLYAQEHYFAEQIQGEVKI